MSEEEILYQIKSYDSDVEDIPEEWRMSLDNGKHYGKATQVYDFTKHRYIVEYVSDNYDIHTEIQTLLQENKQLKSILTELEEWTKSEYDRYYNDKENLVFSNVEVIDFSRVLKKIQELKEKYK